MELCNRGLAIILILVCLFSCPIAGTPDQRILENRHIATDEYDQREMQVYMDDVQMQAQKQRQEQKRELDLLRCLVKRLVSTVDLSDSISWEELTSEVQDSFAVRPDTAAVKDSLDILRVEYGKIGDDTVSFLTAVDSTTAWDNRGYPDATVSLQGIASFADADFAVTTGEVTIDDKFLLTAGDEMAGGLIGADSITADTMIAIHSYRTIVHADSEFVIKKEMEIAISDTADDLRTEMGTIDSFYVIFTDSTSIQNGNKNVSGFLTPGDTLYIDTLETQ